MSLLSGPNPTDLPPAHRFRVDATATPANPLDPRSNNLRCSSILPFLCLILRIDLITLQLPYLGSRTRPRILQSPVLFQLHCLSSAKVKNLKVPSHKGWNGSRHAFRPCATLPTPSSREQRHHQVRQLHHDVTIEISSVEVFRLISSPPLSADSVQESVTKLSFRTLVTISRLR